MRRALTALRGIRLAGSGPIRLRDGGCGGHAVQAERGTAPRAGEAAGQRGESLSGSVLPTVVELRVLPGGGEKRAFVRRRNEDVVRVKRDRVGEDPLKVSVVGHDE